MSKPNAPTLRQQSEAVSLAAVNLAGHINNLEGLVPKGRRPQHELDHARSYYPALNAASVTLAFMEKHEDKLRALIEANK